MASEAKKNVEALIEKAAQAKVPLDAMQFAQAALNAANAAAALRDHLD